MVELNRIEITGKVTKIDSNEINTKREHTYKKFILEHQRTFEGKTYTHNFNVALWDEKLDLMRGIKENDNVIVIGRLRVAWYKGQETTEINPDYIIKVKEK